MTLTNAYVSIDEYRLFATNRQPGDEGVIEACVAAASRMIDRWCGRPHGFWQDSTVQTRTYHADSPGLCFVDDISTTTGLVVKTDIDDDGAYAQTLTITTDFVLYPLNAGAQTPARPWNEIRIVSDEGFPTGARPGVQVTAKFGWPTVPDEVRLACLLQAQMLMAGTEARTGIVQTSVDGLPTRMSRYLHPQAELLLDDFRQVAR